ncbi:MAG TPA: helix-turn-helix transcriptional regulator [Chlamydiales bacterium]|nr:helix-turn-helix transcriptional regulator [Chlamydiales bacterium]
MEQGHFETRIKEFRARRGWTQEQLAIEVGVSRETIIYLEKGKYNPSLKLAFRIAKALLSSIEELFIFKD